MLFLLPPHPTTPHPCRTPAKDHHLAEEAWLRQLLLLQPRDPHAARRVAADRKALGRSEGAGLRFNSILHHAPHDTAPDAPQVVEQALQAEEIEGGHAVCREEERRWDEGDRSVCTE